jgi:hypothetical protein
MTYIAGDFWRICDSCGSKFRASQTLKRWDGQIVCHDDWEPRHPQDFVRGRLDRQNVPEARPEPVDAFVGPLQTTLTADVAASGTTLTVESSARFEASDHIGITCANGDVLVRIIDDVPTSLTITITTALHTPALSGAKVINYSAVAEADIG